MALLVMLLMLIITLWLPVLHLFCACAAAAATAAAAAAAAQERSADCCGVDGWTTGTIVILSLALIFHSLPSNIMLVLLLPLKLLQQQQH